MKRIQSMLDIQEKEFEKVRAAFAHYRMHNLGHLRPKVCKVQVYFSLNLKNENVNCNTTLDMTWFKDLLQSKCIIISVV